MTMSSGSAAETVFAHSALRITVFGPPAILLLPRALVHNVPAPGGLSTWSFSWLIEPDHPAENGDQSERS
jgi:hypothetical protein